MAIIFGNLAVLILFALDRVLKYLFIASDFSGRGRFLLGDFFQLKLSLNRGIAFGFGADYYLIIALYLLIILALVFYLLNAYRKKHWLSAWALTLILTGGCSNLIDRLKYGGVIDYFDLKYFSVFNLADALICLGVVMILVNIFLSAKNY